MQKKSNNKFLIGLAVALLLPLSFYLVISWLSKSKVPHLPKYQIVERITPDGDTIYHKTADIELINQFGEKVSLNKDLKGKMLVVNFFFTRCETICPKMSGNMYMLQKAFKKDNKKENSLDTAVQFISITVDPSNDSVPVIRSYADKYRANPDHWWFLTGDRTAIYNFARNELHITMQPGDGGADDFIHSQKMVLIDTARYVRGYYDGTDTADVIRCADDVVILTKQKNKKK
jgi:protein SCO1/2